MEKKRCFSKEEYQRILCQDRFFEGDFVEYMNKIKSFIQNETLDEEEMNCAVEQAYVIACYAQSLDEREGANCISVYREIHSL